MTRRLFAALGLGLLAPDEHRHDWHDGPFYITAAVTFEEPHYYPPGGLVPVQTCDCGAIRLKPEMAKRRAGYLNAEEAGV